MSLESDVSDLVTESRALINTFNAKKNDIESAVLAALAAAPDLYNKYYVDVIIGDDNNDGSLNSPFKTLGKAISAAPISSYCFITLTPGQEFVIDQPIDATNKHIYLYGDSDDRPLISNITDGVNATRGISGSNCLIKSLSVNYKTASYADSAGGPSNSNGMFNCSSLHDMRVIIYAANIELSDTSLFSQYAAGVLDSALHLIVFTETGANNQGKILTNRNDTVFRGSMGGITLPAGKTFADMFSVIVRAADNEPKNILTNATI